MKFHGSNILAFIASLACAAGCDPPRAEPQSTRDIAAIAPEERERLAADAVEALADEMLHEPDYWLDGLDYGAVELGTWVCSPKPSCPKLPCQGPFPSEPQTEP